MSTTANGTLIGTSWSDGVVVAFSLGPDRMGLVVRSVSGGLARVEASGVREVNVAELWEGAILSEFVARRAGTVPDDTCEVDDAGWGLLFRGRAGPTAADVLREARRIAARRPEPLLFEIETAYGGRIAAVCDELRAWDGLRTWDERPAEAGALPLG